MVLFLIVFNMLDANKGQEILKTFSSISSGFVGLIIGHYFTSRNNWPLSIELKPTNRSATARLLTTYSLEHDASL